MKRPWITPEQVKAYTEHIEIQQRSDEKLKVDISRAEAKIISITHNNFEGFEELPEAVTIAAIITAEAYAKNAIEQAKKQIKSETFDDYSYTIESSEIDLESLNLEELLDEYIIASKRGNVVVKMRGL
jgi:vacuolar-type H+-ATPase subunit E/Vma4